MKGYYYLGIALILLASSIYIFYSLNKKCIDIHSQESGESLEQHSTNEQSFKEEQGSFNGEPHVEHLDENPNEQTNSNESNIELI